MKLNPSIETNLETNRKWSPLSGGTEKNGFCQGYKGTEITGSTFKSGGTNWLRRPENVI